MDVLATEGKLIWEISVDFSVVTTVMRYEIVVWLTKILIWLPNIIL